MDPDPIRGGRPWTPIRIRKIEVCPTLSGSTTLALIFVGFCLGRFAYDTLVCVT
jgi:hypothetical protein